MLDNLKLWAGIAIVLLVLAYGFPLASIVARGGLFGPDVGLFPVLIDPTSLVSVLRGAVESGLASVG